MEREFWRRTFLAWKESIWESVAKLLNLKERSTDYQPGFIITPLHDLAPTSSNVFMDVDISNSGLTYTTGDHVAIWPNNPNEEVDNLLRILNLWETRNQVVDIKPLDSSAKAPFPTPTTFYALFRYYLEICAPVSRQLCATLAPFAPNEGAKRQMAVLGQDKELFLQEIRPARLNLALLLSQVSIGQPWRDIPHSAIVEGLSKLQPRYYSISSSSLTQSNEVSITAVVESKPLKDQGRVFKGVATNYLLAVKYAQTCEVLPESFKLSYQLHGPRNARTGMKLPIHIRHSHFKLPADTKCPIIMVGPGTGIAPFRGFVQERARNADQGREVGETLLFLGCRKASEDLIYVAEWERYKKVLGNSFKFITAPSREGPEKVYVQHRLQEHGHTVARLILQGAQIYICGDAGSMAREVHATLIQIMTDQNNMRQPDAERFLADMKTGQRYQEDIW